MRLSQASPRLILPCTRKPIQKCALRVLHVGKSQVNDEFINHYMPIVAFKTVTTGQRLRTTVANLVERLPNSCRLDREKALISDWRALVTAQFKRPRKIVNFGLLTTWLQGRWHGLARLRRVHAGHDEASRQQQHQLPFCPNQTPQGHVQGPIVLGARPRAASAWVSLSARSVYTT